MTGDKMKIRTKTTKINMQIEIQKPNKTQNNEENKSTKEQMLRLKRLKKKKNTLQIPKISITNKT